MNQADQLLGKFMSEIFTPIYQVAVGIAIIYFLYGAAKYIVDLNNPEKKTEGRSHLLWGMFGLLIILSVGGIIRFFGGLFQ